MRPVLSVMIALITACDDTRNTPEAGPETEPETMVEIQLPELGDGWTEVSPGGDTVCSRGTDYSFFVRKGTVNKVVVDFMGGGACWDEVTCSFADAIFNDDVEVIRDWLDSGDAQFSGIYDTEDAENPYADWYHVFIPYCTGDIHWGDSTVTYGEGDAAVTIEHKGAVNARAALDWVEEGFSAPENIFVTGCSAGAYGSIMWTPTLLEAYPDAVIAQMGDSGAGIVMDDWFAQSFPSWNAEQAFPSWIPELDPDQNELLGLDLTDLYTRVGTHYPGTTFAQYNTRDDGNQQFYYQAMGGNGDDWSEQMLDSIGTIQDAVPNFRAFLDSGSDHCIVPYSSTYTAEQEGVRFVEWMGLLSAGEVPDSVTCEDC